jgi:hypothetical protein
MSSSSAVSQKSTEYHSSVPAAAVIAGHQFLPAFRRRHAARFGIAPRQMDLPEVVVEIQVEQGAVHVEQDGVDARPVDHCARFRITFHGEIQPLMMKHAKGELNARPSHPPLTGRLLVSSLRSIITGRSERVFHARGRI